MNIRITITEEGKLGTHVNVRGPKIASRTSYFFWHSLLWVSTVFSPSEPWGWVVEESTDCFIVFLLGEATRAEKSLETLTCMVKGWSKLGFSTNQKGFEIGDLILN